MSRPDDGGTKDPEGGTEGAKFQSAKGWDLGKGTLAPPQYGNWGLCQ